jgi:hypothetical protein
VVEEASHSAPEHAGVEYFGNIDVGLFEAFAVVGLTLTITLDTAMEPTSQSSPIHCDWLASGVRLVGVVSGFLEVAGADVLAALTELEAELSVAHSPSAQLTVATVVTSHSSPAQGNGVPIGAVLWEIEPAIETEISHSDPTQALLEESTLVLAVAVDDVPVFVVFVEVDTALIEVLGLEICSQSAPRHTGEDVARVSHASPEHCSEDVATDLTVVVLDDPHPSPEHFAGAVTAD